ncbi:hypothetical protein HYW21_09195 [Candidatus Woesearchaeota archaeon]|nr:hypothetical protein [Candidatus Woesearchaeota archaeon]
MKNRESELAPVLGENYRLALLAAQYYHGHGDISPRDLKELERLVVKFRQGSE